MTETMMDLHALVEKSPDVDVLRETIGLACGGMAMDAGGASTNLSDNSRT